MQRASDLLVAVSSGAEEHKARILDLAFSATEELRLLAQEHDCLWIFDVDRGHETLNQIEYKRRFEPLDPTLEEIFRLISQGMPRDPNENVECQSGHVSCEGSRANGVVYRSPVCLVSMFMDEVSHSKKGINAKISNIPSHSASCPCSCSFVVLYHILCISPHKQDKWTSTFSNIVSKAINLAGLTTGDMENANGSVQVVDSQLHLF